MEAVARVIGGIVQARVAHQIDDRHTLGGEAVDHRRRHPDRRALRGLALGERCAGLERHRADIRYVEDDEAGGRRLRAQPVHQPSEIVAKRPHPLVDVAGRVVAAGAGAERAGDDIGLVGARENRNQRSIPLHERHFLIDEVADDGAVRRAEVLKRSADDAGWQPEIEHVDRETPSSKTPRGDEDIAGAVRAIGLQHAHDARANPRDVARPDGGVDDGRATRGRSAWLALGLP